MDQEAPHVTLYERSVFGVRSGKHRARCGNASFSDAGSLAVATALRIERDITTGGLESGTFIGTLKSLSQQYGAGRQATREAIRLLELRGIARARPGPGGGLIVARSAADLVAGCVGRHLMLTGTFGREQTNEARCAVGAVSVALACRQPTSARLKLSNWLRAFPLGGEKEGKRECNAIGFPVALAFASGNVIAQLFSTAAAASVRGLSGPDTRWLADAGVAEWSSQCEQAIIGAIGKGDVRSATGLTRLYIRTLDAGGSPPPRRQRSSEEIPSIISRTRAGQIARAIIDSIDLRCQEAGAADAPLGTIDMICEEQCVSRATAVQALRMLEMAGVIAVRSGRGHGYYLKPIDLDLIASQLQNGLRGQRGACDAARTFDTFFRSEFDGSTLGGAISRNEDVAASCHPSHLGDASSKDRHDNAVLSVMAIVLSNMLGESGRSPLSVMALAG